MYIQQFISLFQFYHQSTILIINEFCIISTRINGKTFSTFLCVFNNPQTIKNLCL